MVEYLGHVLNKEGINPVEKKVEAILAAKPPKNVEQLQSFMGMVNYFARPFLCQMWLILVDMFSKWPEVTPMSTTTAKHTIQDLRLTFGWPENIVTDNGPQFVSKEFKDFTSQNGIRQQGSTLPSQIEWTSRKVCADIQNGNKEDAKRRR